MGEFQGSYLYLNFQPCSSWRVVPFQEDHEGEDVDIMVRIQPPPSSPGTSYTSLKAQFQSHCRKARSRSDPTAFGRPSWSLHKLYFC